MVTCEEYNKYFLGQEHPSHQLWFWWDFKNGVKACNIKPRMIACNKNGVKACLSVDNQMHFRWALVSILPSYSYMWLEKITKLSTVFK